MKRLAVLAILAGAMLTFVPSLADPYLTPKLVVCLLACAALMVMPSETNTPLEVPVLVMLAAVTLSALYSWDGYYAFVGTRHQAQHAMLGYFCYGLVLAAVARSGVSLGTLAEWVTKLSIPVSIYALAQKVFPDPLLWAPLPFAGRVISTQGGPVFLGALMALVIVCAIYTLSRRGFLAPAAVAVFLAALALVASGTRSAMLAAGVGALLMVPWRRARAVVVGACIVALLASGRILALKSDLGRLEGWDIAYRVFLDSPMTGVGVGNYLLAFREYVTPDFIQAGGYSTAAARHAHNEVLHILATMGLVGIAAYGVLIVAVLYAVKHAADEDRPLLIGALGVYAVLSQFNPVPVGSLVLMAAIIGAGTTFSVKRSRWRPAPAAVALILGLMAFRICEADYFFARAVVEDKSDPVQSAIYYELAAKINPYSIELTAHYVEALGGLINLAKPAVQSDIGYSMIDLAARGLQRHPRDSHAFELYGKALVVSALLGNRANLRDAVIAFERAQRLAPTFAPIMRRRISLGRALGNDVIVKLATRDLAEIERRERLGREPVQ